MTSLIKSVIPLGAIACLFTFLAPIPAEASNQFDVCINRLSGQGVDSEQAGAACADALIPKELAGCVVRITKNTTIAPEDALTACYQVRRPTDLSRCVVDIDRRILNQEEDVTAREESLNLALDTCRRSLLPSRHAECVVGLTRSVSTTPTAAMTTCISAEDFPTEVFTSSPTPLPE